MEDFLNRNENIHFSLWATLLFFSSPLIGPLKNVLSTLCMRVWSPGARVGHACVKVVAMNGIQAAIESAFWDFERRGIEIGRFGFEVAAVGKGGSSKTSGVNPGIRTATTF